MIKLRPALLLAIIVLSSIGGLAQAQEDPQTLLAGAAARNFLISLTRPALRATIDFYLAETVKRDPLLAELRQANPTGYEITSAAWLDKATYRVEASLQPGPQLLQIDVGQERNLWQVTGLRLGQAPPPAAQAGLSQSEVAPASDLPGRLVFQTKSGGDIYVINADGTGLRYLTYGIDPELSPDGRQVAFTRWNEANEGAVYVLDLATGQERVVLAKTRQAKSPSWSPDGQWLVVSFQRGRYLPASKEECDHLGLEAFAGLNAADIQKKIRAALRPLGGRLEFSRRHTGPGGVSLCYLIRPDVQWGLRRVNVATGAFEDPPADLYSYGPTWHPARPEQWIYKGERSLILYDAPTQTAQTIGQDFQDHTPVISPDGGRIAVSYWQHDHWEVHTMNVDGSNRQRLTETPLTYLARQDLIVQKEIYGAMRFVPNEVQHWNNAAPTWSPDGQHLAFLTDRTGRWEIWLMNKDGSNQRPMFPNGVLAQVTFTYAGVDERMLSWRLSPGSGVEPVSAR